MAPQAYKTCTHTRVCLRDNYLNLLREPNFAPGDTPFQQLFSLDPARNPPGSYSTRWAF